MLSSLSRGWHKPQKHMSNLTAYKSNDGIEIYIDTITGESFCSIRGYARMAGVSRQAIQQRVGKTEGLKSAEMLTETGLRVGKLIDESTIVHWLTKDSPETLAKFATVGVRLFLHQLAGYQVTSTAMAPNLTRRQMLEQLLEAEIQLEAKNKEIDCLVEQVTTLEPKAIAWDNIADEHGLIKLNDLAGAFGIGRTTLTRRFVDMGIFFREGKRNRAYAKYVNQGYFVERMTDVCNGYRQQFTTFVTKTGAEWLAKRLAAK